MQSFILHLGWFLLRISIIVNGALNSSSRLQVISPRVFRDEFDSCAAISPWLYKTWEAIRFNACTAKLKVAHGQIAIRMISIFHLIFCFLVWCHDISWSKFGEAKNWMNEFIRNVISSAYLFALHIIDPLVHCRIGKAINKAHVGKIQLESEPVV